MALMFADIRTRCNFWIYWRLANSAEATAAKAGDNLRPARKPELHKTIVSPRPGPTLTMDNFPPVNSEMYRTYFLAAPGSCENLRAECVDVFQPGSSS